MLFSSSKFIWVVGYLLSAATIFPILLSNRRPTATLAWIWAVILFPYGGPLFYFLFGSDRMHRQHFRDRARNRLRTRSLAAPSASAPILTETLSAINIQPVSTAEACSLLVNGASFYDALELAIQEARRSIDIEFYIWRKDAVGDRFRRALTQAARRGVKVRVLLDEMGCYHLSSGYFRELIDAGGRFSWFGNFDPSRNRWLFGLRNHRKLQIVDGEIAFVGGMNMGREYLGEDPRYSPWYDLQVRVTGAVVKALENVFADDWFYATDEKIGEGEMVAPRESGAAVSVQVVEDGPDSRRNPLTLSLQALIQQARRRLWVATAYFVPTEALLSAFKLCAAQGVDVRLLISAKNNHFYLREASRSYYQELLSYGIRIFEFEEGCNHGKAMVVDDAYVSIGSANFDFRSLNLNFELNLIFQSPALAEETAQILAGYYAVSREIDFETHMRRPLWNRMKESFFRPLAPIL